MTKLSYVITIYSDGALYNIGAVFSSKKKAKAFCDRRNKQIAMLKGFSEVPAIVYKVETRLSFQ